MTTHRWVAAAAAGTLTLCGGCASSPDPQPAPDVTATQPTPSGSAASGSATSGSATSGSATSGGASGEMDVADCEAVTAATNELTDALTTELDRLSVDVNSPQAVAVTVIITSRNGPAYWGALADAAPADLTTDAQRLAEYYTLIDERTRNIEIADGSDAAIDQASTEFAEATSDLDQDPAIVKLQESVRSRLQSDCRALADAPTP